MPACGQAAARGRAGAAAPARRQRAPCPAETGRGVTFAVCSRRATLLARGGATLDVAHAAAGRARFYSIRHLSRPIAVGTAHKPQKLRSREIRDRRAPPPRLNANCANDARASPAATPPALDLHRSTETGPVNYPKSRLHPLPPRHRPRPQHSQHFHPTSRLVPMPQIVHFATPSGRAYL